MRKPGWLDARPVVCDFGIVTDINARDGYTI
jgi:hypothetical protein